MKKLYVTKRIPKDATILLVDLEREYFDEVLDAIETEEGEKIVKSIYKGKKICLLGFKESKVLFKEEVLKQGGELLWIEESEDKSSILDLVSHADLVMAPMDYLKQDSNWYLVEYCKGRDILIKGIFEEVDIHLDKAATRLLSV